jgi:small-conductance mechanosensitive channel
MEWLTDLGLAGLLTTDRILGLAKAVATLVVGLFLARLISRGVARLIGKRVKAQESMLLRRIVFYTVLALVTVSALHQLGVNLSILLGAAGILTVALGFASQTSASNLISGLFLVAERPFVVGDYLRFENITGEVLSVDLLSVKLRTFDNLLVRIPNENIIKTQFTNLTHFPIRRVDLKVGVAYKENVKKVREVLFQMADRNPRCLEEPKPRLFFVGFGDSALEMELWVWTKTDNFFNLKTELQIEIKEAFDEAGIEIPFPHRTLYTGSVTEPFPVRLVEGRAESPPAVTREDVEV